jgi:Domain of unknown function (DUF6306)
LWADTRPAEERCAPKSLEFSESFAMTNNPNEPTSASRAEIAAFLNELLEAERAGTTVALRSAEQAGDGPYRDLLRDVHHDEARWCAMLLKQLHALNEPASTKVGAFRDKALAIEALPDRIAFLNRGQGWVVRKLREMLPKVRDDALQRDLSEMLTSHEVNIARANEILTKA